MAAAVLATATAYVGLGGWQARLPAPGRAYAPHTKAVIQLARARQHRRHQRIAQAAADTTAAGGGGAAAPPHLPWPTGTHHSRRGHHDLPAPAPPACTAPTYSAGDATRCQAARQSRRMAAMSGLSAITARCSSLTPSPGPSWPTSQAQASVTSTELPALWHRMAATSG